MEAERQAKKDKEEKDNRVKQEMEEKIAAFGVMVVMNQQVEDSKLMAFSEDKKLYNLQRFINNLTRVMELS